MRVPLPLLWPKSSSKFVCKINEGVNLHPLQVVYKNNSITRRLSGFRERFGGNNLKQGHCDLLVTKSKICYKPK